MDTKENLLQSFAPRLRTALKNLDMENTEEVRIRVGKPLCVRGSEWVRYPDAAGNMEGKAERAMIPTTEDLTQTVELLARYSLYAVAEELRQGFFTLPGGHRLGLCGHAITQDCEVRSLREPGGLCLRLCHARKGCGRLVYPYLWEKKHPDHTLILSPPGCGKTTLLRDLVRLLSENGLDVGLVDERSEVAGCFMGVPQMDVGPNTDVLDACPKAVGMRMLLRSMSPQVIAVDELGGGEDIEALKGVIHAGVSILCTVHGGDLNDLNQREGLRKLVENGVFRRILVLTRQEVRRAEIFDGDFRRLGGVTLCSSNGSARA